MPQTISFTGARILSARATVSYEKQAELTMANEEALPAN